MALGHVMVKPSHQGTELGSHFLIEGCRFQLPLQALIARDLRAADGSVVDALVELDGDHDIRDLIVGVLPPRIPH